MDKIYLIYGDKPQEMVSELIKKSKAFDNLKSNMKVVLKPNLVVSREEWRGINTDPRIVEAIVLELKKKGVEDITIADGSGGGQSASLAFEICGYTKMARQHGLKLQDLERDEFVELKPKIKGPFKTLQVAKTVWDCDFLINIPIIKAHQAVKITCAMKNIKGSIPRSMKRKFHWLGLDKSIAQLNSVLKPDLIVVDGLQGNLEYETGNKPTRMDRILIGTDPIEMDSVIADMIGYTPREIKYIAHAVDEGIGNCELNKINVEELNKPSNQIRIKAPANYQDRFSCEISAEAVCCTCLGNLMAALERLDENGMLSNNQNFMVGKKSKPSDDRINIAVGMCAIQNLGDQKGVKIKGCPPRVKDIVKSVENSL